MCALQFASQSEQKQIDNQLMVRNYWKN
jgi:hypothetical protein